METNKLLHFITVHDTQNMRKASELLHISHSALSKSLRTLEVELGVQLFEQYGRGIISTEFANELYKRAKIILQEVNSLNQLQEKLNLKSLKISTFEVFSTYFLNMLEDDILDFEIEFQENLQGSIEESVSKGYADIGITYEPVPYQDIDFLKIGKIAINPFVLVGHFNNLETLKIPFVAPLRPINGAPSGVRGLDGWPDHQFKRNIKYHVDLLESAMALTRKGKCAIFLPDFIVNIHNKIVSKNYRLTKRKYPTGMKTVNKDIYIVKRKDSLETSEIKKVAKYLRKICL